MCMQAPHTSCLRKARPRAWCMLRRNARSELMLMQPMKMRVRYCARRPGSPHQQPAHPPAQTHFICGAPVTASQRGHIPATARSMRRLHACHHAGRACDSSCPLMARWPRVKAARPRPSAVLTGSERRSSPSASARTAENILASARAGPLESVP